MPALKVGKVHAWTKPLVRKLCATRGQSRPDQPPIPAFNMTASRRGMRTSTSDWNASLSEGLVSVLWTSWSAAALMLGRLHRSSCMLSRCILRVVSVGS